MLACASRHDTVSAGGRQRLQTTNSRRVEFAPEGIGNAGVANEVTFPVARMAHCHRCPAGFSVLRVAAHGGQHISVPGDAFDDEHAREGNNQGSRSGGGPARRGWRAAGAGLGSDVCGPISGRQDRGLAEQHDHRLCEPGRELHRRGVVRPVQLPSGRRQVGAHRQHGRCRPGPSRQLCQPGQFLACSVRLHQRRRQRGHRGGHRADDPQGNASRRTHRRGVDGDLPRRLARHRPGVHRHRGRPPRVGDAEVARSDCGARLLGHHHVVCDRCGRQVWGSVDGFGRRRRRLGRIRRARRLRGTPGRSGRHRSQRGDHRNRGRRFTSPVRQRGCGWP